MTLAHIAGDADRIVVVDTETTGVYDNDRIVEIAVVTLALNGQIIDQWDTLINPERAVTATTIHKITDSMVINAPRFTDIAGDLAIRLQGACIAAHNVPFDLRMINNEYQKIGGKLHAKLVLDTLLLTKAKLPDACAQWGIPFTEKHQALDDAIACANLLARVASYAREAAPATVYNRLPRTGRMQRRADATPVVLPDPPFIAMLAARLSHTTATHEWPDVADRLIAYLDLVDRNIADLHLDPTERGELVELAHQSGLTDPDIAYAHRSFVDELVQAALNDHILTEDEYDTILRVAHALDVPADRIETALKPYRTSATALTLQSGVVVTFTGDHPDHPRDAMVSRAKQLGLDVAKSTTKQTQVLIAADPNTQSGKATKALQYGIPVISVTDFASMSLGDPIDGTSVSLESRKVIECPDCHCTWTVSTRSHTRSKQTCNQCSPG